jgi:hypothetical protein
LEGLDTYHPRQSAVVLRPALRAKILAATRRKPMGGSTHWSCRKLATAVHVSKHVVHRVWREAGSKPHRLERYLASDDPDFETKAAPCNRAPSESSAARGGFKYSPIIAAAFS